MKNNKIILGTVQFGLNYGINNTEGKPSVAAVKAILDAAYSNNITMLDTAEAYGDSQEVIGNYHRKSQNKFKIVTKFSFTRIDLPENWIDRVKKNLEALAVDHLYCYMFHNYNDFLARHTKNRDIIQKLKEEGLIRKFGISVYSNEEIEQVINHKEIDVIQLPFNLLDNYSQRNEVLKKAKEKGIEIHTRSVFLQGLFFKNIDELPLKIQPLKKELMKIRKLTRINKISLSDLALNYVYSQSLIDNVLIGVDSVNHLNENIKSLQANIPSLIFDQINTIEVKNKALLNPSNWN